MKKFRKKCCKELRVSCFLDFWIVHLAFMRTYVCSDIFVFILVSSFDIVVYLWQETSQCNILEDLFLVSDMLHKYILSDKNKD